jgi:aspartate aminotransferase-like enzyme
VYLIYGFHFCVNAVCRPIGVAEALLIRAIEVEFGERLLDHGRRFGLKFEVGEFPWGQPFDLRVVRQMLERSPAPTWLWCTHCETSSGVLNDLARLKALCSEFQVKLCLDCMSSIGTTPVDLTGVYLGSCASGKGLRSYPGIGMVFYHHDPVPSARLPRYLDLGQYASQQGIPFTFSSNLLHALHAAIKRVDWTERFAQLAELSGWLRGRLREMGFNRCHQRFEILVGNGPLQSFLQGHVR